MRDGDISNGDLGIGTECMLRRNAVTACQSSWYGGKGCIDSSQRISHSSSYQIRRHDGISIFMLVWYCEMSLQQWLGDGNME